MAALVAEHVTKIFDAGRARRVTALHDVDLRVEDGELVCLVGSSGCGKSTLLFTVAGFVRPTAGRILLGDEPVTGIERRCGILFQSYALFPWKTVRGNVEFPLKLKGLRRQAVRERAAAFIKMVNLAGFEDLYPTQLSGGMQQRVALARVLAGDPEVLLMDEPFAALDAMTRQVLQQELLRVHQGSRKTTLFVTHNIDEALLLSDRIVVMRANPGRVQTIIQNTLPHPRTLDLQGHPDWATLKGMVWDCVSQDVYNQIRGEPQP